MCNTPSRIVGTQKIHNVVYGYHLSVSYHESAMSAASPRCKISNHFWRTCKSRCQVAHALRHVHRAETPHTAAPDSPLASLVMISELLDVLSELLVQTTSSEGMNMLHALPSPQGKQVIFSS